jgi:hypothetical protein
MDIERGCLEVLLKKIPHSYLLDDFNCCTKKSNSYTNISKKLFVQHSSEVFPMYTINEIENIHDLINEKIGGKRGVFDFISDVSVKFLIYDEDEPQCRYNQILRWRDISFKLGQDLFTTAYLAKIDTQFNQRTEYFAWSPIIKTDNKRLHNILNKGMAENHFHLNGSTQIFALSWVSLMNNIIGRQNEFKKIGNYMDSRISVETGNAKKRSLYTECMLAAFIRAYLFCSIKGNISNYNIIQSFKNGKIDINDVDAMWLADLQRLINAQKEEYGYKTKRGILDYAIEKSIVYTNNNDNRILAGERKFLYDCFIAIFQDKFDEFEKNCFYVYLLIKNLFRSELIQVNGKLGFKNFSLYQDRKEIFIDGHRQYQYELVRMALNSTLSCQEVVSLEARICPKKSGEMNKKIMKKYDSYSRIGKESKPKHFYVLHFPKSPDKGFFIENVPRNNKVRINVAKCTKSIVQLLEMDGNSKYRVKGIDACSHEIGCRPEVFAQSFRYLTNFNIVKKSMIDELNKPIKLSATYHAGEDFLDIVDGLRAIDEAILFCNLKRGNRLGHALALGIDSKAYYELKNYKLILNNQDVIDNTAWLLEKSREYGICLNSSLVSWLEHIFFDKFNEVYGHCKGLVGEISIYNYFNAWKLRGDKPDIYTKNIDGLRRILHYNDDPLLQSQYYDVNRLVSNSIRENEKCTSLYYCYHYDKRVRENGSKQDVFKVDMEYVHLVDEIQKKMMLEISEKGIAIETNPSSNYLIGTINRYDQHPILRFNNLGLELDNDNPLISVSINTDDQGVFDTMLENEYALLAYALEKSTNKNGERRYKPEKVYRWIDYIRELGIEQAF